MTSEFTVIGEHREANTFLLVLGTDGRCYAYHPARGRLTVVEPDERWVRIRDSEEQAAAPLSAWLQRQT